MFGLIPYFYPRFLSWFPLVEFVFHNRLEIAGVIFSVIYLYFSITRKIWLWPFGILSAVFYILIYFNSRFYADMGLQVYYVLISVYGWWNWTRKLPGEDQADKLLVRKMTGKEWKLLVPVLFIIWALLYVVLITVTDSDVPLGDSFTTAGGVVATWMLARKIIEHWFFWIIIDLVSAGLYVYKGLYPTSILFIVYTTMAVVGYLSWKKEMKMRLI